MTSKLVCVCRQLPITPILHPRTLRLAVICAQSSSSPQSRPPHWLTSLRREIHRFSRQTAVIWLFLNRPNFFIMDTRDGSRSHDRQAMRRSFGYGTR